MAKKTHTPAAIAEKEKRIEALEAALKDAQERFAGGSQTNGVFWRELACAKITEALAASAKGG